MARLIGSCGLALLLVAAVGADDKHEGKAGKHPGLERLKKLAGEWLATDAQGRPTSQLVSVFKVTAGGSAVQETIFPGSAR